MVVPGGPAKAELLLAWHKKAARHLFSLSEHEMVEGEMICAKKQLVWVAGDGLPHLSASVCLELAWKYRGVCPLTQLNSMQKGLALVTVQAVQRGESSWRGNG